MWQEKTRKRQRQKERNFMSQYVQYPIFYYDKTPKQFK